MQIAVISDLHLGRGGSTDDFGHDDAEFLGFLDHLERNFERVVLAGDVWETLTSAAPRRQLKELHRCKAAHPEIAKRFERPVYTTLHGNHDIVSGLTGQAPEALHLNVDGQRILFTHGHQMDWINRHARWASEFIAWLGGWALRLGLRPLKTLVEAIEHKVRGESALPEEDKFQLASLLLAEQNNADIIVTGHTHQGVVAEHGDKIFMNSGSCAMGEFSFLSLDTARGDYALNTAW